MMVSVLALLAACESIVQDEYTDPCVVQATVVWEPDLSGADIERAAEVIGELQATAVWEGSWDEDCPVQRHFPVTATLARSSSHALRRVEYEATSVERGTCPSGPDLSIPLVAVLDLDGGELLATGFPFVLASLADGSLRVTGDGWGAMSMQELAAVGNGRYQTAPHPDDGGGTLRPDSLWWFGPWEEASVILTYREPGAERRQGGAVRCAADLVLALP